MIILLVTVLLATFLLTSFVRKQAVKRSILDIPNHRSSHTVPTPRGGGLAIAIIWYLSLGVLFFAEKVERPLFLALLSGSILTIVSLVDDLKSVSPSIRFAAQFISAVLALISLGGFLIIDVGFIQIKEPWLLSLFAIPFIIWFINLFNFLDGIDGYLGMEAIIVFGGMWFFTSNILLLILISTVIGFLLWNWPMPKAKIFCGDVGSTLIGFNVAIFAIYFQNTAQLSIIIPLILSSLFWFDATITLFRRWKNKEKLSEAHRKHIYQRIVQAGFSHSKTVYLALLVNLLLWVITLFIIDKPTFYVYGLLLSITILWGVTKFVDQKKAFDK